MEQQVNIFSKEAIRARMMQNATSLWGLKNAQSLDPFVKLLIEAFSTEIFKVSNEVNNIKTRMLEKMARLLTPTIHTIPQPAHAVGFAHPTESGFLLKNTTEFSYKRKLNPSLKLANGSQVEIPFTPIDDVHLVQAKVLALFTGNACYSFDSEMNKVPVARISSGGLPYATIILAIEFDKDFEEQLQHLCFYYQCPDFEHQDWIYSLLPYAEYSINGHKLSVEPGLKYGPEEIVTGYRQIFNEYTTFKKIKETVKTIYNNQFITIRDLPADIQGNQQRIPPQLSSFGSHAQVAAILPDKYVWLTIKFPPQYNADVLDNFRFVLNAFPVINRKLKQNECKFDLAGNNIPLITDEGEHFLMVSEVSDSSGSKFEEIPFSQMASMQKGLYSIRVAGMERFDERNAIDLINYILELTRDEVAAYGNIERDTVIDALKGMLNEMKILKQKVKIANVTAKQISSYIIAEPYYENENMHASYWITNCTIANNLRAGSTLSNYTNSGIAKGFTLLTTTEGGSEAQKGTDAIQAYRYALTSRDRIITTEDIKNFCKTQLRNMVSEITVSKSTAISSKPKEGFIRTLEVIITPVDYDAYNEAYWQAKARSLMQQIELRAVDGIEYRVFFKQIKK